jgi:hypothetical protein
MRRLARVPYRMNIARCRAKGPAEGGIDHLNPCSDGNIVEYTDHIARFHADASVARRSSNLPLLGSAVNVNPPVERSGILRLQSTQVQDAGDDGIPTGNIGAQDLPGALPILEDCPDRRPLSRSSVLSPWRPKACCSCWDDHRCQTLTWKRGKWRPSGHRGSRRVADPAH